MTETPTNKEETEKSWVKPATEYGPPAVFLITYYSAGIYAATAALMGATAIALTFSFVINRRLPLMPINCSRCDRWYFWCTNSHIPR